MVFSKKEPGYIWEEQSHKMILHRKAKVVRRISTAPGLRELFALNHSAFHVPVIPHRDRWDEGISGEETISLFSLPSSSALFRVMHKELSSLSLFFLAICTKPTQYRYPPFFVHKHTLWTFSLSPLTSVLFLRDLSKCTLQIRNTAVSIESHCFFCSLWTILWSAFDCAFLCCIFASLSLWRWSTGLDLMKGYTCSLKSSCMRSCITKYLAMKMHNSL